MSVLICALTAGLALSGPGGAAVRTGGGSSDAVRYGYDLESTFTNLDPGVSSNTCDKNVWTYLYDSIVREGPGDLRPGLAERWDIAPDGSSVTLYFRPGTKYHDGSPLTADTVRQGLEYNAKNVVLGPIFSRVASYEVIDDTTLKVNLKDPYPLRFLFDLTGQPGMVVAPSAFGSADEDPVGAGPFKFVSYRPGATLELERDPDHWEADAYEIDGIEYRQTGTGNPSVTALRAGDVDVVRFTADLLPAVKKDGSLGVASKPTGEFIQLQFRVKDRTGKETPFADPRVRQAVNYALDREEINRVVEAGSATVTNLHYPDDSPFHVASLEGTYDHDPKQAKALLKEAGHPKGFSAEIIVAGGGIAAQERQAELVKDQLGAVGIKTKVTRVLPQDVFLTFYQRRAGDMLSARQLQSSLGPGTLFNQFGRGQQIATYTGNVDDQITELTDQAYRATSQDELNRLTQQMEAIAVDNALDAPIAFVQQFVAWDKDRLAGKPGAPYDSCVPIDLRGVSAR
jgi:peptide/nickel transport system substrate-binding protein/glutathione transport system substrate-binding protein